MDTLASAPRLYIFKSDQVKIAHQPGFALYGGRWHKIHHDKPAPKGAPLSAHPTAAGVHAPVVLTNEQIDQLKYPAEKAAKNPEMAAFNDKHLPTLLGHAAQGDATAIVGSKYGTNTHAKKQVLVANYLLEQMGSKHKVSPGQGAGWHAAVEHAPAEPAAPAPADQSPTTDPTPDATPTSASPAAGLPELPQFDPNYKATPFYQKLAAKLKDLADAGDIEGLKSANDGSAAWQGKSQNSKQLLHFHLDLIDALQGAAPAVAEEPATPPAPAPAPTPAQKAKKAVAAKTPKAEPSGAPAKPTAKDLLAQIPWDTLQLPTSNTNAATVNKKLAAIKTAAEAGDVAALEAMTWGKNTYNKKLALVAQAAIAALKEGAPAQTSQSSPTQQTTVTPEASQSGSVHMDGHEYKKDANAEHGWQFKVADSEQWHDVLNHDVVAKLNKQHGGATPEPGPKDGDTKPAADGGTLVFKDGHWHKQDEPAAASPAGPELVFHHTEDGHNKQWSVSVHGSKLVTKYGKIGKAQQTTEKDFGSAASAQAAKEKLIKEKTGKGYKPVAGAASAPAVGPKPAPAPKPQKPAATPGAVPSMDDWQQIGPQGGSNPGGKFKAPDGTEYYCKFPENEDIAKSEVLAAKLYAAAGLASQRAMLVTKGGKIGIASKWVEVKKGKTPAQLAKTPDAQGGFAVDAWLGNWDVVGLGYDNLQIGADGKAVRVDAGGSLEYRAQGSKKKPGEFGPHVTDLDTLRDASKNPQAASIFGKMTQADIAASVAKVAAVTDEQIKGLVEQFGPGDAAAKKALAVTLIARKADLLAKYPKAAQGVAKGTSWVRLKPGERIVETGEKFGVQWAKIKVPPKGFHADAIPTPPNFFMNGNQGPTSTWKSSVQHVNEANNQAGQSIYDAAIHHKEPEPVQNLTFDQIDKATGQKTGVKMPFAQHPAGEIKEYFKQVTAELEAQTKATYKTVQNGSFTQSYSAAAMSLAADFTPVDYTKFKAHAAKAADYLVLSKSAAAGLPSPDDGAFEEQWENVSPKLIEFKNACKATFQALTSAEQTACKAYTGSAYANWNQALRSGDTASGAYHNAQPMVKAFKKAAIDIPEGTILWRGIGVGEDTYKSVTGAVIQDGSFQSSSFGSSPAFSGHKTWLKIHVGKGVKGLHATSFSNFGSSEREIIIKNNVRYAVLNVTHHKNFVDSKGHSHGPKTIVDLMALPHED